MKFFQNELGCLGLLPVTESEHVGILVSLARHLENQLSEELVAAQELRDQLKVLHSGINRIRKSHQQIALELDECESSEREASNCVAAALERCQHAHEDLRLLWQEIMTARQILHRLPTHTMRVSMSPGFMERSISARLDMHEMLEKRCKKLLDLLRRGLGLWRNFEKQLENVQQSKQEAEYLVELITIQGGVDYERMTKASQKLDVSLLEHFL